MFQRTTVLPAMQRLIPRKRLREERSRRDYSEQDDTNQENNDVRIAGSPRVIRRFATDRFNHHLNGQPGCSLAEFLDVLPRILRSIGDIVLGTPRGPAYTDGLR